MLMTAQSRPCVVGLSGGVDSSVAAHLLGEQYLVSAIFMKNWSDGRCPWEDDLKRATEVAQQLSIPLTWVDGTERYYEKVFTRFIKDLHEGYTPNPDIWCNEWVKFELLSQYAPEDALIATGHYARIGKDPEGYSTLCRARDLNKDQSYFLSRLSPQLLGRLCFPLGDYLKPEVRALARSLQLVTAEQPESMGICFIGPKEFRSFLKDHVVTRPGPIYADNGQRLGTHDGLLYYTLGQRKGHGIGGVKNTPEAPWYVVDKRLEDHALIVSQNPKHPNLYRHACRLSELHWFITPPSELRAIGQPRHRHPGAWCTCDTTTGAVVFDSPQWALTPGQHIAFYLDDRVLGSGVIQRFDP